MVDEIDELIVEVTAVVDADIADLKKDLTSELMDAANLFVTEAKSFAPFRTGRFSRNIKITAIEDGVVWIGVDETEVPYAPFVIWGSSKRPPHPYRDKAKGIVESFFPDIEITNL